MFMRLPRESAHLDITHKPRVPRSIRGTATKQIAKGRVLAERVFTIRIPMAFIARSQRVRCGHVPIASSDVATLYFAYDNWPTRTSPSHYEYPPANAALRQSID
jgi:hypothetical protein